MLGSNGTRRVCRSSPSLSNILWLGTSCHYLVAMYVFIMLANLRIVEFPQLRLSVVFSPNPIFRSRGRTKVYILQHTKVLEELLFNHYNWFILIVPSGSKM